MTAFPEDELLAHAQALRHLARALVGAQDADDLVQDAALQALVRPPRERGSWFGWLAAVVRNRASKMQRGDRRRRRHEAAAEPFAVASSPVGAAAQREMVQRLHAALMGLAEPYQGALLLRYFEGLTPSEIAERTREPVATVKSRLQRGLGMLRERLSEGRGDDWRAGLVTAFGLKGEPVVVGAVLGGVAMTMTMKCLAGAVAVALAAFWLSPDVIAPSAMTSGEDVSMAKAAATQSVTREPSERIAVPGAEPASMAGKEAIETAALVMYIGRCLDEAGNPLANARIELTQRCPGVPATDIEGRTGADGRFLLQARVGDEVSHEFQMRVDGACAARGTVVNAVAGERDLGDIVLPIARTLLGRVVDTSGTLQTHAAFLIGLVEPKADLISAWRGIDTEVRTDESGTFTKTHLPPGDYRAVAKDRRMPSDQPIRFVVDTSALSQRVEFVVEPAPPPVRGVVVDASGSPIAAAWVRVGNSRMLTKADGRFELVPPLDAGDEAAVAVDCGGYESNETKWRRADGEMQITLQRQPTLVLHVTDARTGAPVTRFRSRLFTPWDWERSVGGLEHPEGLERLMAPAGRYRVYVEPEDPALAPASSALVDLVPDQFRDVIVALAPYCERPIVIRAGGAPVAEVRVELVDTDGEHIDLRTQTATWGERRYVGIPAARRLAEFTTAGNGRALLRGPAGSLALRISGGGIATQVLQPVRLDESRPLLVDAVRGASLRGRLVPEAVARRLYERGRPSPSNHGVGVNLYKATRDGAFVPVLGWERLRRINEAPFEIDESGAFQIDGIPPGRWDVLVHDGPSGTQSAYAVASIEFAAGQDVVREFDIRAMDAAQVTLRVTVDGVPAARRWIQANNATEPDAIGRRFGGGCFEAADEEGRVRFLGHQGDLSVMVYLNENHGSLGGSGGIRGTGPQDITIELWRGALDLTCLLPDGTPAAGISLSIANLRSFQETADHRGHVSVALIAAGTHTLVALPRTLQSQSARDAFAQANGYEALHAAWIPVGTITVAPGPAVPQTLRLPEAWAR